jgi:hypothetical protein
MCISGNELAETSPLQDDFDIKSGINEWRTTKTMCFKGCHVANLKKTFHGIEATEDVSCLQAASTPLTDGRTVQTFLIGPDGRQAIPCWQSFEQSYSSFSTTFPFSKASVD